MKASLKSYILCTLSLACGVFTSGCSDSKSDGPVPPSSSVSISVSPASLQFGALEAQATLDVTCTGREWTAYVSDNSSSWLSVSVNAAASEVSVNAKANTTSGPRSGSVIVKSGTSRAEVTVTQAAPMQVSATDVYAKSSGETITIKVTASADWTVTSGSAWISASRSGNDAVLTVQENTLAQSRAGSVTVSAGAEHIDITVRQESAEAKDMIIPDGYHLVWNDEFSEGTELNSAFWTHEVQNQGWVNNEIQNYVNGGIGGQRVTEIQDGRLMINCFKQNGKVYSGRVYACRNTGWKYGYVEARIQLPAGKGTWPAFWMMPVNFTSWPADGEIDIMEEVGYDPEVCVSTIHCSAYNHTIGTQKTRSIRVPGSQSEYHVYALEWTPDAIKTYVDGNLLFTFANDGKGDKRTWPFSEPFYVILNLAWGGDWGGAMGVDESFLPATMKVDYVRVFQKN